MKSSTDRNVLTCTYEKCEPWLLEKLMFCVNRSVLGSNTPDHSIVAFIGPPTVTCVAEVSYVRQGFCVLTGPGCAGAVCPARAVSCELARMMARPAAATASDLV